MVFELIGFGGQKLVVIDCIGWCFDLFVVIDFDEVEVVIVDVECLMIVELVSLQGVLMLGEVVLVLMIGELLFEDLGFWIDELCECCYVL